MRMRAFLVLADVRSTTMCRYVNLRPGQPAGLADAPVATLSDYGRKPAASIAPEVRYKYDVYTAAASLELFVGKRHPDLANVCRKIRRGHVDRAPDDTMPIYLHNHHANIMTASRAHACAVQFLPRGQGQLQEKALEKAVDA